MKNKLHEFIETLMNEQKVVVVDYYSGKVYIKNRNARSASYMLEYDERLRDSEIYLVENDMFKANTICIHVLKSQ